MKKNYFQVLNLSVLIVLLLSFSNAIKAQTFVGTDVSIYDTKKTDGEVLKLKKEALGSVCILDFYDKNVKLTITKNNNAGKETLILDKISDSKYQAIEQRGYLNGRKQYGKAVVELQKLIAYINSFTLYIYENEKLQMTVTYKRK